jgi:anti-sigma B factor antagonist
MIHASPFEVRTEVQEESARLRVSGELDIATAPRLEDAVAGVLTQGVSRVLIDLSGVTFVDSSGLRLCIVLSTRAPDQGWQLALIRPTEPSISVFRLTGAEQNLPFVEDPGSP